MSSAGRRATTGGLCGCEAHLAGLEPATFGSVVCLEPTPKSPKILGFPAFYSITTRLQAFARLLTFSLGKTVCSPARGPAIPVCTVLRNSRQTHGDASAVYGRGSGSPERQKCVRIVPVRTGGRTIERHACHRHGLTLNIRIPASGCSFFGGLPVKLLTIHGRSCDLGRSSSGRTI